MAEKDSSAFLTISEASQTLDVPKRFLRFWEGKFPQIKPMRRGGGRRYYRPKDIDLLKGIKHLLYKDGHTIVGVQAVLKKSGVQYVKTCWQNGAAETTNRGSVGTPLSSNGPAQERNGAQRPIRRVRARRAGPVAGPTS